MKDQQLVLAQLQKIRGDLLCTRMITLQLDLLDARSARAHQLVDKIADALTVVGQLIESEGR